jgi:hypothetical protein
VQLAELVEVALEVGPVKVDMELLAVRASKAASRVWISSRSRFSDVAEIADAEPVAAPAVELGHPALAFGVHAGVVALLALDRRLVDEPDQLVGVAPRLGLARCTMTCVRSPKRNVRPASAASRRAAATFSPTWSGSSPHDSSTSRASRRAAGRRGARPSDTRDRSKPRARS